MDKIDVFHWDSCLFYEHLKGEPVSIDKKIAVGEILLDNKEKRNRICTSIITHAEVLPKKLGVDSEAKYWSLFGSMHFYDVDINRQLLELAREIKDFYYIAPDADGKGAKMLSTGDAFQLSTAIIEEVTQFHTHDGNKRGGNIPLLGLADENGRIAKHYPLTIISPSTAQGNLDV